MKFQRMLYLTTLIAPVISLLFIASVTLAQLDTGAEETMTKSAKAEEYDKKALKKLEKMSPEEVEELDKMLAKALTLFYDRDYARALPIFKEISGRVETMDVTFWFASCAAKAGETELAIKKFEKMLKIDPNLHRVRLELATVYYQLGRYEDARNELNKVLKANPPEGVRNNINKLLASIDAKSRKFFPNFRVSLGLQYDSNVSSGPDHEYINIPGGGGVLGPLTNTQRSLRDWTIVANMYGNLLYDFGESRGFLWNTTGSFYQTHNWEYYQFDYTQARVSTGLWYAGKKSILKIPFAFAENFYEHDHLFDTVECFPSYEYFFTPSISLKGTWHHTRDRYIKRDPITGAESTGQDNTIGTYELNPNFFFNNRRDILSFYISDDRKRARDPRFSYDGFNAAVSYFKRFNLFSWDMEFYARYKYSKRDYITPALLWPVKHLRTDKKHNFYLVLSRNFLKHFFASISYNWINNQSNTDLYDFDKFVYGINVGFKF